jgi:ribosomal protein S4
LESEFASKDQEKSELTQKPKDLTGASESEREIHGKSRQAAQHQAILQRSRHAAEVEQLRSDLDSANESKTELQNQKNLLVRELESL